MSPEDNTISEHIHDADSETNENMLHWLHQFMMGKITQNELKSIFIAAYQHHQPLFPPTRSKPCQLAPASATLIPRPA
jgi:hypothetical protein